MQAAVFVDENAAVVIVGADDAALRIALDHMHRDAGLIAQQLALATQDVEMRRRIGAEEAAGDAQIRVERFVLDDSLEIVEARHRLHRIRRIRRSADTPRMALVSASFWPLDTMPPLRVLPPAPISAASATATRAPCFAASAAAESPQYPLPTITGPRSPAKAPAPPRAVRRPTSTACSGRFRETASRRDA